MASAWKWVPGKFQELSTATFTTRNRLAAGYGIEPFELLHRQKLIAEDTHIASTSIPCRSGTIYCRGAAGTHSNL